MVRERNFPKRAPVGPVVGLASLSFALTVGLTVGLGAFLGRAAAEPTLDTRTPSAPEVVPNPPTQLAPQTPVAPAAKPALVLPPPSELPLTLLATLVGDDPAMSRATLLDQQRLRMASFSVGDPLRPGVILREIRRGRVVVEEQGELRGLNLGNQPLEFTDGPTPGLLGAGLLGATGAQVLPVNSGALSVGRPNQGRLINAVRLPDNPVLYTRTQPNASWGASHTILSLQQGIARFRRLSGYRGNLAIGGISREHGGFFPPHKSHQSGRDVDIVLPRVVGDSDRSVDWQATWSLVHTLIEDGQVTQIFLSYERQRELFLAARAAGVGTDELERWLQYPKGVRGPGIIRHQPGHRNHLHIRFRCGPEDRRCSGW